MVEKLVTLGKRGDLHARRQAIAQLKRCRAGRKAVRRAGAAATRSATAAIRRVLKAGFRYGDNAADGGDRIRRPRRQRPRARIRPGRRKRLNNKASSTDDDLRKGRSFGPPYFVAPTKPIFAQVRRGICMLPVASSRVLLSVAARVVRAGQASVPQIARTVQLSFAPVVKRAGAGGGQCLRRKGGPPGAQSPSSTIRFSSTFSAAAASGRRRPRSRSAPA